MCWTAHRYLRIRGGDELAYERKHTAMPNYLNFNSFEFNSLSEDFYVSQHAFDMSEIYWVIAHIIRRRYIAIVDILYEYIN